MTKLIGQSIGRYHILEQLGQGGMAIVYKAYDTRLERDVAIKVIRTDAFPPAILERVLKRFEREAKALAKLDHPNIVAIYDYGEHEGAPYLVMPYLPGGTLKQRMGKPVSEEEAVRLITPIAQALSYAHEHGILHRDVKPSNILIGSDGVPRLGDFGIGKLLEQEDGHTLTGTGVGIGTPEYMAPEQGLGRDVDARADVYSLGIVLYELVTGRKPYTADTPMAVVVKHLNDPLLRPRSFNTGVSEEMERVIFKALAKKIEDRYGNMGKFVCALNKLNLVHEEQGSNAKRDLELKQNSIVQKNEIVKNEPETQDVIKHNVKVVSSVSPDKLTNKRNKNLSLVAIPIVALILSVLLIKFIFLEKQNGARLEEEKQATIENIVSSLHTETAIHLPTIIANSTLSPTIVPTISNGVEGKIAIISLENPTEQIYLIDAETKESLKFKKITASKWELGGYVIEYKDMRINWVDYEGTQICTGACIVNNQKILTSKFGGTYGQTIKDAFIPGGCNKTADNVICGEYTAYPRQPLCVSYFCPDSFSSVFLDGKKYFIEGNTQNYYPVWSPDGQQFLFLSLGNGDVDLILDKQNRTPSINLTKTIRGEITFPAWSMDSKKIVFVYKENASLQNGNICYVDLETTEITCVTKTPEDESYPSWSPDGKFIAFSRRIDGDFEIYLHH